MKEPLTFKQAVHNHRVLWRWLAKHPSAYKSEHPAWAKRWGDFGHIHLSCWLCEWVIQTHCGLFCRHCPLEWGSPTCVAENAALFTRYCHASTDEERSALALKIAKLPLKEQYRESHNRENA